MVDRAFEDIYLHIMNRIIKRLSHCLCIVLLFFAWNCTTALQKPEEAKVVNIADGDTFTLLYPDRRNVKVRLYGIDTPERGQEFGAAARKALGQLLEGRFVWLEEKEKDRYGRTVAIAYRDDGLCINEEMLRTGYAWHYTQYDQNPAWKALAIEAKKKKLGFWTDANPTPPWEWRKMKRKPKAPKAI